MTRNHRLRRRVLAIATALALPVAIMFGASSASAHTPSVGATCDGGVFATGTNYEAQNLNVLSVTLDGVTTTKVFSVNGSLSKAIPQDGLPHTWKAAVKTSNSNPDYSKSDSGTITCGKPQLIETHGNVVFHEGSVVCEGTRPAYTQPSYETSGEHVIFDAPVAAFGATITVHASAADGYVLTGDSSFTHTFGDKPTAPDCRTEATVVSPTITQPICTGPGQQSPGSFELPANADGVKYTADGNVVTAHVAVSQQGTVKLAAQLPQGWTRVSDYVATYTVVYTDAGLCLVKVHPVAPVVTQAICTGPGTNDGGAIISAINSEGITYSVDGNVVTATLSQGYRFGRHLPEGWVANENGSASFTVVFDAAPDCLVETTPVAPKVTQPDCIDGKVTAPRVTPVAVTGVVYTASSTSFDVTAQPAPGYRFAGESQLVVFKVDITKAECPVVIVEKPKSPPLLAFTGINALGSLGLAALLLLVGIGSIAYGRRPQATADRNSPQG